MKKSLIAIAVVGAFSAPAFADTTLYGTVDAALANVSNTGQKSQSLVVSGGLAPSLIGVKGAEDLGGGTKAIYKLEFNLDTADQSSVGAAGATARNKYVGLAGEWGAVVAGYLQTAAFDYEVKFDPTAGSSVSAYQNIAVGGGFLLQDVAGLANGQRALAYISPDMSGFKVAVNYVTAAAGLGALTLPSASTQSNQTADIISATYDNGPAAIGLIYGNASSYTNAAGMNMNSVDAWSLGGSYDFGAAKLLGTYQSQSVSGGGSNNKMYSLSGVIPAGPGAIVATYAKSNMNTTATSASSYTGAYLYSFSKKTTLYVAYSHTSNDSMTNAYSVDNGAVAGVASASMGGSSSLVALGLSKSF